MSYFSTGNCPFERIQASPVYRNEKLVSLEVALESIKSQIDELTYYIKIAKQICYHPSEHGLTHDESASIYIYTMDWGETSLCRILRKALRYENRQLRIWFSYLKLFDSALQKVPIVRDVLYRGLPQNIGKDYIKGQEVIWPAFTSCSTSLDVIKENFADRTRLTIFLIETRNGKDISCYSAFKDEKEVILNFATKFRVSNSPIKQEEIYIVRLVEINDENDDSPVLDTINLSTISFYNACRNNNIDLVKYYLEKITLEEINKIQPNGSTALHAAAYYGHEKIVELLLEKGAYHSLKNKYNLTPLDEAKTDEIKQMIRRRRNQSRFICESIEWILATNDADFLSSEYYEILKKYGKDPNFDQLILYIKENYLKKNLFDIDGIDLIQKYFNRAIDKKDPSYLLKAYTAETEFYSTLNRHLTQLQLENLTLEENLSRTYYIGILSCHPKFEKLSYIGIVYRGMMITTNDLKQYKRGIKILTKTFSSTSIDRKVALQFLDRNYNTNDCLSTLCIYEIRNQRTALNIKQLSEYPNEQEVLILPYSAFKILEVKMYEDRPIKVEITLKESEPW